MLSWYTNFMLVVAVFPLLVGAIMGFINHPPGKLLNILLIFLEIALLGQLVLFFIKIFSGATPKGSAIEILGYLFVALLIPAASFIWGNLEKTRWSSFIISGTGIITIVMITRIGQLWYGIGT